MDPVPPEGNQRSSWLEKRIEVLEDELARRLRWFGYLGAMVSVCVGVTGTELVHDAMREKYEAPYSQTESLRKEIHEFVTADVKAWEDNYHHTHPDHGPEIERIEETTGTKQQSKLSTPAPQGGR